jgi:hypothetical protein
MKQPNVHVMVGSKEMATIWRKHLHKAMELEIQCTYSRRDFCRRFQKERGITINESMAKGQAMKRQQCQDDKPLDPVGQIHYSLELPKSKYQIIMNSKFIGYVAGC